MYTYLFDRKQRTKISLFFSSWQDILSAIPQGLILGTILFKIFLCDLFFIINNIHFASYTNNNTPYTIDENPEKVISKFEIEAKNLIKGFYDSQTKANPNIYHLLTVSTSQTELETSNETIKSNLCEKLLGSYLDINNKARLDTHVEDLCRKATNKIHALSRATSYMTVLKRRILMNAFFKLQISYCPFILSITFIVELIIAK